MIRRLDIVAVALVAALAVSIVCDPSAGIIDGRHVAALALTLMIALRGPHGRTAR